MHVWREKKELESIAGLSCTDRSSHTQPEEREAGSKLPSLKDEQREETLEASYLLSKMNREKRPWKQATFSQGWRLPSHVWAEEKRVW